MLTSHEVAAIAFWGWHHWKLSYQMPACQPLAIHNSIPPDVLKFASHMTYHTAGSDTIFIQIYTDAPPGVPRVLKESEGHNYQYLDFALIISPNWTIKNDCFVMVFQILCNLGWILAQKHIKLLILWSFWVFWHPWHPWGRIHIEDIMVFVFVFDISEWWRPLQVFFFK